MYINNLEFKLKNGDIIVVTKSSLNKSAELFNTIFTPLIAPLNIYNIFSNQKIDFLRNYFQKIVIIPNKLKRKQIDIKILTTLGCFIPLSINLW